MVFFLMIYGTKVEKRVCGGVGEQREGCSV